MKFKSTKQTDNKLNELFEFLESKIDIMNNLSMEYKSNSIEHFLCETCNDYIHGSKLEWINDTAICPVCESRIKI